MSLIKQILSSKKALATIAAILVWIFGRVGWDVAAEDLLPVIGALASYALAQGFADRGKESTKLELEYLESNPTMAPK